MKNQATQFHILSTFIATIFIIVLAFMTNQADIKELNDQNEELIELVKELNK